MNAQLKARLALLALSVVCILAMVAAAGCNTLEGITRDVRGMYDGMNHAMDSNGGRVPSGR